MRLSGLPERSIKRRFAKATGHAPIAYVQRLRIEEARRQLERTSASIEDISWSVGYEDAAFFHRLFKRFTNMTPGAYLAGPGSRLPRVVAAAKWHESTDIDASAYYPRRERPR